jgi:hypothetical protein
MCIMPSCQLTLLVLAAATLGQQPPGSDYYAAAMDASRQLSNQVQYLQEAIIAVPRPASPPGGDGLFQQTEDILSNLQVLRAQLRNNAGKEPLALSLAPIDRKLNGLASEIQGMERWNPGLRMVARRVRYAQQDLHFAILGTDGAPQTQADVALRQTLVLQDRTHDCLGVVRYVFAEQEVLPAWNKGFANFRGALSDLQNLEQTKASRDDIKKQLLTADQSWARLVDRFNKVGTDSSLLLRSNFAQVDRLLDRLSTLYGVPDRRAALKDPFAH